MWGPDPRQHISTIARSFFDPLTVSDTTMIVSEPPSPWFPIRPAGVQPARMNSLAPSRKRRGLAEIQLRIAEFKSSGLSKTEFAAKLAVHPLSMDRWLRITHSTQSPQPTQSIASQNSRAFVPVLCTPSASASSADGPERVATSGWTLRLPPCLAPSTLRSILDILPRCKAFSPTLGSISRSVRPIFASPSICWPGWFAVRCNWLLFRVTFLFSASSVVIGLKFFSGISPVGGFALSA